MTVLNPWLIFPQFYAYLTYCFAQLAHNFKVVFLIDHTTLWQEFMMHHTIAIEENSEQNLNIWPNLTCILRSRLFWTLPLGWLGFGFNIIAIHLWFATSYDVFEQFWIVVEHRQQRPDRCPCDVVFAQNFAILEQSSLPQVSWIAWHGPNDVPISSAISQIAIRRLTKLIFFTASIFSSVVDALRRRGCHSLNRLSYNWTCVLLMVDSPNVVVSISNLLAHLI